MMETANDSFQIVGQCPAPERTARLPKKWFQGKPLISIMILAAIILGCLCAELIMTKDPHLYGSAKLQSGTEQRVFIWNGYHGKGYFFHALVRRQDFPDNWSIVYLYFYFPCNCDRFFLRNCTPVAGQPPHAFYRNFS